MKAAADMIVHSTGGHLAQSEQSHFKSMYAHGRGIGILPILSGDWLEANATTSRVKSRQEIKRYWPGKFWRTTEAALFRIVTALNLLVGGV